MHKFRCTVVFFMLLTWGTISEAAYNSDYLSIQRQIYSLELDSALAECDVKLQNQETLAHFLKSKALFLKAVLLQSASDYEAFLSHNKKTKQSLSGKDLISDKYFYLEEVHFYEAIIKARQNKLLDAANSLLSSYKYGKKSIEENPEQKAALKTLGLIEAGLANLPSFYKSMASGLGFKSDLAGGIKKLEDFHKAANVKYPEWRAMKLESAYFLSLIYKHQKNDSKKATDYLIKHTNNFIYNPLQAILRADLALKNGRLHQAHTTLLKSEFHRKKTQLEIPYRHFIWGEVHLFSNKTKEAKKSFKTFLAQSQSKDFVKSAYQRLAWIAALEENKGVYLKYCDELKEKGQALFENDQQAQKEAEARIYPNPNLLRSRILFDGKQYKEALQALDGLKTNSFNSDRDRAEYAYRKGRIYEKLKDSELAIAFYKEAMVHGKELSNYFASYAALYCGEIYLGLGNCKEAKVYLQKSTSFKANKEYRNSIERRAKMGLQQCK
jgi:hypothetical protein